MKSNLLIFILVITSFWPQLYCQNITNEGTDFWFGFTEIKNWAFPNAAYPTECKVHITSKVGATGTVSVPGTGFSTPFIVASNGFVTVYIPEVNTLHTSSETVINMGINVVSDNHISVTASSKNIDRAESTLVLPNSALGSDYMISTYQNSYAPGWQGSSEFLVVAAGTSCTFDITTTANTFGGLTTGTTWQVTLAAGEMYQVRAANAGGGDLTGTTITASNGSDKFAVYAGHQFCSIANNFAKDWFFEVEYPTNTWGKECIAVPVTGQDFNMIRVLARENCTEIFVDGVSFGTFNAGEFYHDTIFSASLITANRPIQVSQFLISYKASTSWAGDPSLLHLHPNEQMLLTYAVIMVDTAAFVGGAMVREFEGRIIVITKTPDIGITLLDGVVIPGWQTLVQDPTYSYVDLELAHGEHTLNSTGTGFLAYSYGLGYAVSYFNSLGVIFDPIIDTISVVNSSMSGGNHCVGDTLQFNSSSTGNIIGYVWDFGDATTSTLPSPTHAYSAANTYPVSVILTYNCFSDTLLDTVEVIQCCTYDTIGFSYIYPDPCDSTILQFTATSTGQLDSIWWSFGFPGGGNPEVNGPIIDFLGNATNNVNLWVYGTCGWSDITVPVTAIATDPTQNYELMNYNQNYCLGDAMTDLSVVDTSLGNVGGSVTWYSDSALTMIIGTGTTISPIISLGSYSYYIVETLACGDRLIDSVFISVTNCSSCPNNLIANPSFETITSCPSSGSGDINYATPWDNPPANPYYATADLWNNCTLGWLYTVPHTGYGYAGFIAYTNGVEYREYVQAPLSQPLIAGHCYQTSMYIVLAEKISKFTVDSMGIGFSNGPLVQGTPAGTSMQGTGLIQGAAQVTNDASVDLSSDQWQLMTGQFIASGGEDYITIGNFTPDVNLSPVQTGPLASWSIYYIDDICLYEIPPDTFNLNVIDTTSCSALILSGPFGYNQYFWYDATNTLVSNNQILNISTQGTTTYTLYSVDTTSCPYAYYRDSVMVTIINMPNAGTTNNISFCPSDPSSDLFPQLGGTPDPGGIWSPVLNSGSGIFDPAIDSFGTYTYTVFGSPPCTNSSAEIVVSILPYTDATIISDSIFCELDSPLDLQAQSLGGTWTGTGITNSVNGTFDPGTATTGSYTITYQIAGMCGDTDQINLEVNENPVISYSSIDDSCYLQSGAIDLNVTGGMTPYDYFWSNSFITEDLSGLDSGSFSVLVTDFMGCTQSKTIVISENLQNCAGNLWLPNIFSPNNDGVNDELYVRGAESTNTFLFMIYNRWGDKVFESTDPNQGWDGTYNGRSLNNAVFAYLVSATFIDKNEASISGTITLVK